MLLLGSVEPVTQVVAIAVEKSLALDEIDEHQPVEHHRGVPLMVLLDGNAGDELEERGVLLAELVVEAFGNPLDVEGFTGATRYIDERKGFFLRQAEGNRLKLLDQGVAGLIPVICVLWKGSWFPRL